MKKFVKKILFFISILCWQSIAQAANLMEVFRQAMGCDPIYQQAIAQRLATKEGVPISMAAILPNISFSASPYVERIGQSGSLFDPVLSSGGTYLNPRNMTQRTYVMTLTVNQTIFNFAQYYTIAQNVELSKGADANLNAALQSLMIRVAKAYFTILQDEDTLSYAEASKLAYAQRLDQEQQQYKVGLKTITDVYTAQASYESAVATVIQSETQLENDKENLRVMTGVFYSHLSSLNDDFPLISPVPSNVEEWVKISLLQNWSIKAARYNASAAREVVNQQFAGHLPTVSGQIQYQKNVTDYINNYQTFTSRNGPGTISTRDVALTLNVPIYSGGGVSALTRQAVDNYGVAREQLIQTVRQTSSTTRQSFNSLVAGISKIKADKQSIKSRISSLEGLEASYQVGTETLVDVLDQQQKVFQSQTDYAKDRYAFVNNILALKQAAGTLSFDDLCAINAWLIDKQRDSAKKQFKKSSNSIKKS